MSHARQLQSALEDAPARPAPVTPLDPLHDLDIEVVTSPREAERTWRALDRVGAGFAFQTFDWIDAWFEADQAASSVEPCIVTVRQRAGPGLMLLPLGVRRFFGVRVLVWLGGAVSDYKGPLAADWPAERHSEEALWSRIREHLPPVDAIHLSGQVEPKGGCAHPFPQLLAAPSQRSFQLDLEHADLERVPGSRARKQLRRARRRAEQVGELRLVMATAAAEARDILEHALRRRGERYQQSRFSAEHVDEFYRSMTERLGVGSMLVVAALKCGDETIATEWGLRFRDHYISVLGGFDPAWAAFSPGHLLTQEMLRWAAAEGLRIYDFSVGDESYKRAWSSGSMPVYEYIEAITLRGRLYLGARRLRTAPARARRLRDSVRDALGRARMLVRRGRTASR